MDNRRVVRRTTSLLLAIFLIFTLFGGSAMAAEDGMIRVKLTRLGSRQSLTFKTNCAYSIGGNTSKVIPSGASCTVALSGGGLTLTVNGVQAASGISLELKRGESGGTKGVTFTSPSYSGIYSGDLLFSVSSGSIQPVLRAYIEDYVVGVVICEMGNSFPVEALKAQAIAARTYAMMMKKSSGSYDLVDNTNAQAYRGYDASKTNVVAAVNATRGMVAYYGGNLARMYYAASNGGQMEPASNVWSNDLPYLVQKDDPYDYENTASVKKSYSFKKDFVANSLPANVESAMHTAIQEEFAKLGLSVEAGSAIINTIDAMQLHSPIYKGESRTYQQLRFTVTVTIASGEQGQISFDLPTYDLLEGALNLSINTSKNETYEVTESATEFTLTARRYGHGVGMSQRGAQWMAAQYGKSCKDILEFYFPGLTYKTVNYADSTGSYSGGSVGSEGANTNGSVQIPENSTGVYGIVKLSSASSKLNMRAKASTSSDVVGLIPNGAKVEILETSGNWAHIRYMGVTGYVMLSYLERAENENAQPSTTPTPDTGSDSVRYAVLTLSSSSSKMNVRKGPSTSTDSLGVIPHGTRLEVLGETGEWSYIRVSGRTGYVKTQYLVFEDTLVPAATPSATKAPSSSSETQYAILTLSSSNAKMHVRKGPSTATESLGTIPHGTRLELLGVEGDWACVRLNGNVGYIKKQYLKLESGSAIPESTMPAATPTPSATQAPIATQVPAAGRYAILTLASSTSKMNIRSGPSTSTPSVGVIPHGTYLEVLGQTGEWSNVRVNGKTGYVKTQYLVMVNSSANANPVSTATPVPTPDPVHSYKTAIAMLSAANGTLGVYASPSTGAKVIGYLKNLDEVVVLAAQDGWAQIVMGDQYGFVDADFLVLVANESNDNDLEHWGEFVSTPTPTAVPTLKPTQAPTAAPVEDGTYARIKLSNSSSSLNVRKGASTSTDVVGRVYNGDRVEVLGTSGSWAQIRIANTIGYVMKTYLVLEENASGAEKTEEELPEFGTVSPTATPVPTSKPSQNGEALFYAMVTLRDGDAKVGVRKSASSSASVILRVPNSTVFEVLDYNDSWAKVRLDDTVGYVSRSYLERAQDTAVALHNITVYSGADTGSTSIGTIEKDVRVAVDAVRGDWARIYYEGGWGYVMDAGLEEDE